MWSWMVLCCALWTAGSVFAVTPEDHDRERTAVLKKEEAAMLGGSLILTAAENQVNSILKADKLRELDAGFQNLSLYNPAYNFMERKSAINLSPVFQFIQKMPKGAALHLHDTALLGRDYLLNITYRDNLYICPRDKDSPSLIFSSRVPSNLSDCEWKLLRDLRMNSPNVTQFDMQLGKYFTLETDNPRDEHVDVNDAWIKFSKIFMTITPMLTFRPVWEEYFYDALKKFKEDGVMYVEVRTTLPELYELNGIIHDSISCAKIYSEINKRFKQDFNDSFGSRIIFAPMRLVSNAEVKAYVNMSIQLKQELGDFFAGFDLVGQEDLGRPLRDFIPELLAVPPSVNVFYHSGETNWYGTSSDDNLIDAVLLGAKRLGHAYALLKHPAVGEKVRTNKIAIEVNPISNQVLKLVEDMRNHPASVMLAENYPIVISSDDPGLWGALPLSHDFYEAFMGLASRTSDLRLLKQLALNSIEYSSMPSTERELALAAFNNQWTDFINNILSMNTNYQVTSAGNKK